MMFCHVLLCPNLREVPAKRPKKQDNKPNKGLRHFSVKVRGGVA